MKERFSGVYFMSEKIKKDWSKIKEEVPQDALDVEQQNVGEEGESSNKESLAHPSYLELEEKLTLAEQQAHENWEKSVRAMAEVDNIRRRTEREIQNAHRYSLEKFANALLPVLDSLEQALQLAEKHQDQSMHEGLELTMKLFVDVFGKFNIQQIDPQGVAFNPEEHEAMAMQEAPGVAPNMVLTVFQKGYMLNDRVIRPARVIVSK